MKAVEVRKWLFRELKCDMSVFDILESDAIGEIERQHC